MERLFYPDDDPECRERQYASYKNDPEWKRIYSFLRRGYWHVTSCEGWNAIRKSGNIKPNIDSRFPIRFEQTKKSYAYKNNCVSLFDFMTPSEEQIIYQWGKVCDVLHPNEQTTVLLRLDRRRLRSKIIPNSKVWPRADDGETYGFIPFCEVWYPDEIPMVAISKVYRVPTPAEFGVLRPEQICKSADITPDPVVEPTPPQWRPDMTIEEANQIVSHHFHDPESIPPEILKLANLCLESGEVDDLIERRIAEELGES